MVPFDDDVKNPSFGDKVDPFSRVNDATKAKQSLTSTIGSQASKNEANIKFNAQKNQTTSPSWPFD